MPRRKTLSFLAGISGWLLAITSSVPAADGDVALPPDGTPAAAAGLQLAPHTTVITSPLNDAGYPDYVAALNERLSSGVSRDENFWVLMWPAIGNAERTGEAYISEVERRLGITISREPRLKDPLVVAGLQYGTPAADQLQNEWDESMARPWTRDEFPDIARWVDAHSEPLSQIHDACLRPKAYAPLVAGEGGFPMIAILLPHVQACRSAARLLVSRSMLRLGEGDVDGSWQDLTDLYRLAGHCERGVTLIEALVGYACRAIAQRPMTSWISGCGLSADELQEHLAELEPLLQTESLARNFDCERFMYLDTVLAMTTGRTNAREMLGLTESVSPGADDSIDDLRKTRQVMFQLLFLGSDVNETLRYGNALYDDMIAAVRPQDALERKARLAAVDARVQQESRIARDGGALVRTYLFGSRQDVQQMPGRMMAGLLLPAITTVERAQTRVEANAMVLRAAFAAQLHLLRTGEIPTTLSVLDPDGSLDFSDPFTGGPLRTVVDDRGLVIYSVGINGIDDNGRTYGDEPSGADDLRAVLTTIP